ncbi:MAG: D-alanyl-D-alanine carboxypeptidase family protein [bacterium]|nr:D-alanyl-D-alanine carboxypeptidase family protein [bacterium]
MEQTVKDKKNRTLIITLAVIAIFLFGYFQYNTFYDKLGKPQVATGKTNNSYNVGVDLERSKVEKAEDKPDFKLSAKGAVLLDAQSNHVLYSKNGNEELPMASTTKIMTCIVALEYGNMDDIVTFSKRAASMPDVQLNAKTGARFKLGDLLYSLMLESHNDTAVAIAEHVGGSVEGFAKMMNKKAKELGLSHTNFVTPNGLDAVEHYTTAKELAMIASYAIKNEDFVKITNTPNWTFKEENSKSTYSVQNKNRFLSLMPGAMGVKTGFTNNAGYCFVGALKRNDKTLISVVLGSGWPPHKTYKWKDTQYLMNYGLDHFGYRNVSENLQPLYNMSVLNGKQDAIGLEMDISNKQVLLRNSDVVDLIYSIPDQLEAPIRKGDQVGTVTYYINGEKYMDVPVTSKNTVAKKDYRFCLDKIIDLFLSAW